MPEGYGIQEGPVEEGNRLMGELSTSGQQEQGPLSRRKGRKVVYSGTVPVSRVLQYQGRRRILRLEGAFWNVLETMAQRREIPLGRFVHELLEECDSDNLTSYIRCFCLSEALSLGSPETKAGDTTALRRALAASPSPCLFISGEGLIFSVNQAAAEIFGEKTGSLIGQYAHRVLRFHPPDLFSRAAEEARQGQDKVFPGRMVLAIPGRLITVAIRVVPLPGSKGDSLVWFTANPPARLSAEQLQRRRQSQTGTAEPARSEE